jgi:hypothetical protein
MNKKTLSKLLFTFSFASVFLILLFITSCESSRVGPELPRPNPPAPPAQPIVLTAYVRDVSNLSAIAGATVKITKADNTVVTTLTTDNSGKYSYDVTNLTENTLIVNANKDGYGFSSKIAEIKKTLNIALVDDILLTKLVVASAPVTPATGGQATTTNPQTVSTTPLTVTVPPNAVPQNITLTVAAVPAAQVPKPPTATNSIQSAAQLGPSGVTFTQPVTVKFPLPSKHAVGKTFNVIRLNPTTNLWENRNITATVDATGTVATAQLTSFSVNAVDDPLTINIPAGTTTSVDVETITLDKGTTSKSYSQTNNITISVTGTVSSDWLLGEVKKKANIDVGTTNKLIPFNFPAIPSQYLNNGVQFNPANPSEAGNWTYQWIVVRRTTTSNWTANGGVAPNTFTGSGQITEQKVDVDATRGGWVWVKHNQGGG